MSKQPATERSATPDCAKFTRRSEGSALIELSLIVPVIVLMLLGVVDLGLVAAQAVTVVDSARAGAEYGTVYGHAASTAAMQTYASNSAAGIPNYSVAAIVVCSCTAGGAASSCTGSCSGGVAPVQYVQVTSTASLPLLFHVNGLPASIPVQAVVKVRTAWTAGN